MSAAEVDLFRPPTGTWVPLSPRYRTMKLVLVATVWPLLIAAVTFAVWQLFGEPWWWVVAGAGALLWLWRLVRVPRAHRRWGYAEGPTDLHLTHGLAWRSMTCVPYGRMQLVNVTSGPLERAFRLASVQMVTASTSGSITIPGLDPADAAALRDRLVARGEEMQAGI